MYDLNDPKLQTLLLLTFITLPIKAFALWRSANNNQKGWFVSFLILNTLGLLEVTYLFYFSKKKPRPDA